MSGGSFNYLFLADSAKETAEKYGSLVEMSDTLELWAPGHPVTRYTRNLVLRLSADIPASVKEVWHAVEWTQSSDWTQDQLDEVLAATKEALDG